MCFVYILKSLKDGSHYVGHTQGLDVRLKRHNDGRVKSTYNRRPWKIIYQENYSSKQEAYKREKQIKSYKGGEAFKRLII